MAKKWFTVVVHPKMLKKNHDMVLANPRVKVLKFVDAISISYGGFVNIIV